MAQRAPEGSMKQVLRPILIYLSPRSPNNNHQQPLKNDLHFGGLLRGMLRGYASGYASGVCFARAPPPTNTYLGPREKNTNPYVVYRVALLPWKAVSSRHPIAMDNLAKNIMETFSQTSKNSAWLKGKADNFNEFDNRFQNLQRKLFLHRLTTAWRSKNCTAASDLLSSPRSCLEWLFELPGKRPGAHLNPSSSKAMPLIGCPSNLITSCSTASPHRRMLSP